MKLPFRRRIAPVSRGASGETQEVHGFARWWALAALAHVAGNPFYPNLWPEFSAVGLSLAILGLVGTVTLLWPSRARLTGLCGVGVVTLVLEGPAWSNHWLLAGLVSLAWLVSGGRWADFRATGQALLLVFYGFASFAKLNSGFFDPWESSAVFYAREWASSWGLAAPDPGGALAAWLPGWVAGVELAVVGLLLGRRTRLVGVWLGCSFHGLLSLDLHQHFYDFTSVLWALFGLFLAPEWFHRQERWMGRVGRWRWPIGAVAVGSGLAIVAVSALAPAEDAVRWTRVWFWVWVPLLVICQIGFFTARQAATLGRPRGLGWLAVGLAVVNGLTPYLEIKTVGSWQMYSNLMVLDGQSNHWLVRRGLPLRPWHAQPVEILESSAPELREYARAGVVLPWPTLRCFLQELPEDTSLRYRRGGEERSVARVRADPELGTPPPWWWHWLPLRSFSAENPDGVQADYLPGL